MRVLDKGSIALAAVVVWFSAETLAVSAKPITLSVGDPAPALEAARLIKGKPIPAFEAGKTYLVDFWATECIPCIAALPHLLELAQKYRSQVSVVSVNIERFYEPALKDAAVLQRVIKFVKRHDNLMDYTVVMDDEAGTLDTHWREASGQLGIPVSYIVADKKIVWLGNPTKVAGPLAQVVAGVYRFNRHEFIQRQIEAVAENDQYLRLISYPPFVEAYRAKDYAALRNIYEQAIAINPRLESRVAIELFTVLLHTDPARASSYAHECLDRIAPADSNPEGRSNVLLRFSRQILSDKSLEKPNFDLALQLAQEGLKAAPKESPTHYVIIAEAYFAKRDAAKAVAVQERAISLAKAQSNRDPQGPATLATLESTLARYRLALRQPKT